VDAGPVEYRIVLSREDLGAVPGATAGRSQIGFDAKMSGWDPHLAPLVGVTVAPEERSAVYLPTPLPDGTRADEVLDAVRGVLEDPGVRKVGHNVKADIENLAHHGVDVAGPLFDTMIAHYLIDAESSHRLEDVSNGFLGFRPPSLQELTGTGRQARALQDLTVEELAPFGWRDADYALRLLPILSERLERDGLTKIAEEVEFPLVYVLADMERTGIKVDLEVLDEIRTGLEAEILSTEAEIYRIAGREFGIGSTQQLSSVLFSSPADGGLGLKPLEKTGKGAHSTNERVLAELSADHAMPGLVLDWRRLTKLKSTYVDALPLMVHPVSGRVHTDYAQTVAATGRLSSQNPNLQNIPIRSERGREIRRAFVAAPGYVLLSADYAQIELRILAHLSGDAGLVEAFESGMDIHTATAMRVFGVEQPDQVTRDMRARVKQVNYGIPYGISAFGLAQRLRIPSKEAQKLIDQWSASYPTVVGFLNTLIERARDTGYAETLLGRRRYIPTIKARNPAERQAAERIAVNMPMQGSQADMIKRAMVTLHRRFREEGLGARMLLQVHDELVFEVPEAEVETVRELVVREMSTALPLSVPIEIDAGVGPNWLDAH
jgi:DNA polymerase-1